MINTKISEILYKLSIYLEMNNVAFKPQAYQKAAEIIADLPEDISSIYQRGGRKELEKIKGIGKGIAEKIEEYIKTKKISEFEKFKKQIPVNLEELLQIEGLGAKKIKQLYDRLKITNIEQLEQACLQKKLQNLPHFGTKSEENILKAIQYYKANKERFLLGDIYPIARQILTFIKKIPTVKQAEIAGSLRRYKETIGDIDIVISSSKPAQTIQKCLTHPAISSIYVSGEKEARVRIYNKIDLDLRVFKEKNFHAGLLYFTGNKEHNIHIRNIAIKKNYKLNEYGLFRNKKQITTNSEQDIYHKLGMQYIPPEMRTDRGEIEIAQQQKIPKLIEQTHIKGDLHLHSTWSDGKNSLEEMIQQGIKMGYKYIALTDHTKTLPIAGGLDEKQLETRLKKIIQLQKKYPKITIFSGMEANITKSGDIDIEEYCLKKHDCILAGIHYNFKMSKEEMTKRIIKAMKNPYVKIIVHPSSRRLHKREGFELDWEKIFKAAIYYDTAMEINAHYTRLDMKDTIARKAQAMGVLISINTDSHSIEGFYNMEFGIGTARRAWITSRQVINTWSLAKINKWLNKNL